MAWIAYVRTIQRPMEWGRWRESGRKNFQTMRSPADEEILLEKNVFVERIRPAGVVRGLTEEEMAHRSMETPAVPSDRQSA